MPLKSRTVRVQSLVDLSEVEAEIWSCGACGGETWLVLVIAGHDAPHLQCVACGISYCQSGTCAEGGE